MSFNKNIFTGFLSLTLVSLTVANLGLTNLNIQAQTRIPQENKSTQEVDKYLDKIIKNRFKITFKTRKDAEDFLKAPISRNLFGKDVPVKIKNIDSSKNLKSNAKSLKGNLSNLKVDQLKALTESVVVYVNLEIPDSLNLEEFLNLPNKEENKQRFVSRYNDLLKNPKTTESSKKNIKKILEFVEKEESGDVVSELEAKLHSNTVAAKNAMEKNPKISKVDYVFEKSTFFTPNDTHYNKMWGLNNTAQGYPTEEGTTVSGTAGVDIKAQEAWDLDTSNRGEGVVVGINDTGLDYLHPDIIDNVWVNQAEIPASLKATLDTNTDNYVSAVEINEYCKINCTDVNNDTKKDLRDVFHHDDNGNSQTGLSELVNGVDNDVNGYTDDLFGWNFITQTNDVFDVDGHGTHVAGTVAASGNNSLGVTGIAYNAKILSSTTNFDSDFDLAESILYAAQYSDVINMSWGGMVNYDKANDPIYLATKVSKDNGGVFLAAASGNSSGDTSIPSFPFMPADFDTVMAVNALQSDEQTAWFSNYGVSTDIIAPGVDILSLSAKGNEIAQYVPDAVYDNDYMSISGTSMASPHVAGVAALIKANKPTATPNDIHQILINSSKDAGDSGFDEKYANGILDARTKIGADFNLSTPLAKRFPLVNLDINNYQAIKNTINITGKVDAQDTPNWKLEIRKEGEVAWSEIATGNADVNGNLMSFDPASYEQDKFYYLRLVAEDTATYKSSDIRKIYLGNLAPDAITVNSNKDFVDKDLSDGICDTGNLLPPDNQVECTFRAAIQQFNNSKTLTDIPFITFNIYDGVYNININTPLPAITKDMVIIGNNQYTWESSVITSTNQNIFTFEARVAFSGMNIKNKGNDNIDLLKIKGNSGFYGLGVEAGDTFIENGNENMLFLDHSINSTIKLDSSSNLNRLETYIIDSPNTLPIDLNNDGRTLNDMNDADTGANDLLNFPVIESATHDGNNITIEGWSRPGANIDFYVAQKSAKGFENSDLYNRSNAYVQEGADPDDYFQDLDNTVSSYDIPGVGKDNTNRFKFEIPLNRFLPDIFFEDAGYGNQDGGGYGNFEIVSQLEIAAIATIEYNKSSESSEISDSFKVEGNDPCFLDVPYDHDFNTYICNLKNDNVIDGYPDGTYKPNNLVNRGAMAKFMINGSGMPINTNCPQFSDIPADYEFANMIRTLKCNGVISGYPDGKYKPNNNVDRGAMAKFIKNGFNIPTNTTCGDFLDVKPTHGFYTEITSLKCANVISGYPDGTYKPNNLVNRGAMAKFIDNARSLVSI